MDPTALNEAFPKNDLCATSRQWKGMDKPPRPSKGPLLLSFAYSLLSPARDRICHEDLRLSDAATIPDDSPERSTDSISPRYGFPSMGSQLCLRKHTLVPS